MSVLLSRGMAYVCVFGLVATTIPKLAGAQLLDSRSARRPPNDVKEADDAKIRELMRAGVTEYRKKNLEGARQAFAEAWGTAPRPEIAAALADVEMKLGRYRDAAEHWDRYLQSKPADQAEAAARLEECRVHVATVRVELDPVGAELDVDGVRVPTDGGGTVWVEPGTHTFAARHEERASLIKRLDLAAGEDVSLRLVLVPASAEEPAATVAPRPVASKPRAAIRTDSPHAGLQPRTVVVIGGATLTVAAAALGSWFLLQRADAVSEHDQLFREVEQENPQGALTNGACLDGPQRPAKCTELFSSTREIDRNHNFAIGGFIGAGVLGAATVVTYLLWPSAQRSSASNLVVGPLGERGARGVQVRVAF